MSSRYFYLDIEVDSELPARPELSAQRLLEEASRQLFGSCGGAGGAAADVLRVRGRRVLLRVEARRLRRLRAALALREGVRVAAEAASLQALV